MRVEWGGGTIAVLHSNLHPSAAAMSRTLSRNLTQSTTYVRTKTIRMGLEKGCGEITIAPWRTDARSWHSSGVTR